MKDTSWGVKLKPLREIASIPAHAVMHERIAGKVIYPKPLDTFNAFHNMEYDSVKVVIIGQDPYHGKGQANGLAFAVNSDVKTPPSLENIFKELESDIGCKPPNKNLLSWRDQGVLLLNTSLTVEEGKAGSHKDIGWYPFVQRVVKLLNEDHNNLVFILWGKHAQEFENVIDSGKHKIIKSAHPSPYSADRGFFGSKPFSSTNTYLNSHGKPIIKWGSNGND